MLTVIRGLLKVTIWKGGPNTAITLDDVIRDETFKDRLSPCIFENIVLIVQ